MSAYRVTLTALNDPTVHHTRDVEAETMCDAIEAVALLVKRKHRGQWEPSEARRIFRPMLHPVEADEIIGAPA